MTDEFSSLPIEPIGVVIKRYGAAHVKRTIADLAELLMNHWPEDAKGDLWRAAQEACLAALASQSNPEAAREAFILAARDAGIPITPVLKRPERR